MINHIKVSRNFYLDEFACKCGCNCVQLHPKLLSTIQKVRACFQKPVIITSAYRCPKHNEKVGGVKNSYHTQGKAVDFWVAGISVKKLVEVADWCGFTGIGEYKGRHFIHCDIRPKKARWVK